MKKTNLQNEKGMIAVDFMFSFVLVLGMAFLVFAFCFALVGAEIAQYITFASARSFSAGHISPTHQRDLAWKKYDQLKADPVFAPLFTNGLFEIPNSEEIGVGPMESVYPRTPTRYMFWGVYLTMNVPLLDFRIPFYGSTMGNEEDGEGFTTNIGSFLGREPTVNECINFTNDRWRNIRALQGTGAAYTQNTQDGGYRPYWDNGC